MNKDFLHEYFSIPNIMGYFRIVLVPVYMVLYFNYLDGGLYWPIIAVIVLSGLTDFLDGKVARRFNMVTEWGKILDPIADKITLGAIVISLAFKYSTIVPMVVLYIIKEGYMGVVGLIAINKGHKVEGAMWYGKVCTFSTYGIFIAMLLFPSMNMILVNVLIVLNMAIMIFTLVNYMIYYGKFFKGLRVEETENV